MSDTVQLPVPPSSNVPGVVGRQGVRLQVRGLRKSYDAHEVLKGIDLEVNPGEIFVIM